MSFAVAITKATDQAFASAPLAGAVELLIAGIPIRLQATDPYLLTAFSTALEHHRARTATPQAVIRVWSSSATGIQRPAMPEAIRERVIARCNDLAPGERYFVDFDPTGRMVTVIDPIMARVDVCLSSIDHLPDWERAAPLRSALNWILRQQDIHLLHSAAVAEDGAGALLLGAGGAGKSTAALRCQQAGMDFLGDDICAVQASPTPRVFNVYGTAKTVWSDLERFAAFQPLLVSKPDSLKAVYTLNRAGSHYITQSTNISVLLLLDRSLPVGSLRRTKPAKTVAIAAATTTSFLPGNGGTMLSALADIARSLPVLRISLSEDPQEVAALVRRAIRDSFRTAQSRDDHEHSGYD